MAYFYNMQNYRITAFGLWDDIEDTLSSSVGDLTYSTCEENISVDKIDPETTILVVFVESKVTKEIIAKLPKLKMIATMSTGFDHIDLKATKKRGIMVCNVPTYGENTVAEHAMALMLGLTRKLFTSAETVKNGLYDFHGLRGVDIKGKTLGVIGTGHIGQQIIKMAHGFEMNIVASDAHPNPDIAKKLKFTYLDLPKLLKTADIVTLHAPLTKQTYHLINKKNIFTMKPGSYLVNTARGALIEPAALLEALEKKHLAGAGLDVLEDENLIQDFEEIIRGNHSRLEMRTSLINKMIIEHPNTIVTPHNAFNSTEALKRIADTTIGNIRAFLSGKPTNVISN